MRQPSETRQQAGGRRVRSRRDVADGCRWAVAVAVGLAACEAWAQCVPQSLLAPCASVPLIPPGARPETGAYFGNQHQSGVLFVHSLDDRQGGWGWQPLGTGLQPAKGPIDLRVSGSGDQTHGDNGNFDIDSKAAVVQGTATLAHWSPFGGADSMHIGAMFGYGATRSDSLGTAYGLQSQGKTSGFSLGAFGTWYQNDQTRSGWYSDLWGQYAWFSNHVDTLLGERVDYNSHAGILSAEGGYVMRWQDSAWSLIPQGQFVYDHNHTYSVTQLDGLQVDGAHRGGWLSRLGVRAERESFGWGGAVVRPFAAVNWWHDALGDEVITNNVSTKYLYPADRFELKAGIDARFQRGWTAWGTLGWQTGKQSYQAWAVQAGTRIVWD